MNGQITCGYSLCLPKNGVCQNGIITTIIELYIFIECQSQN